MSAVGPCFLLSLLVACASPDPEPWSGDSCLVGWTVLPGRLLAAPEPLSSIESADPSGCLRVEIHAWSVDADLPGNWTSILDAAQTLVALDGETPVEVTSFHLDRSAVSNSPAVTDGYRPREIATMRGLLHPSGTFTFFLMGAAANEPPCDEAPRPHAQSPHRIELRLTPEGTRSARAAILVRAGREKSNPRDFTDAFEDMATEGASVDPQEEAAVLQETLQANGHPTLLLIDPPFAESAGRMILLQVTLLEPPGTPEYDGWVEGAEEQMRIVAGQLQRDTVNNLPLLQAEDAVSALQSPLTRRSALQALADLADAPVASDLALLARIEVINALMADPLPPHEDSEELRWALESRALVELVEEALSDETTDITEGLLNRHTGALMRYPSQLRELVANSDSAEQLRDRIIVENQLLLEDYRASDRVRAFDWLQSRDLAPRGFDPLADRESRREALREAEAERTAADRDSADRDSADGDSADRDSVDEDSADKDSADKNSADDDTTNSAGTAR